MALANNESNNETIHGNRQLAKCHLPIDFIIRSARQVPVLCLLPERIMDVVGYVPDEGDVLRLHFQAHFAPEIMRNFCLHCFAASLKENGKLVKWKAAG